MNRIFWILASMQQVLLFWNDRFNHKRMQKPAIDGRSRDIAYTVCGWPRGGLSPGFGYWGVTVCHTCCIPGCRVSGRLARFRMPDPYPARGEERGFLRKYRQNNLGMNH